MISTLTDIRSEVSWSDLYIMDLMNSYKNLYIYIYIIRMCHRAALIMEVYYRYYTRLSYRSRPVLKYTYLCITMYGTLKPCVYYVCDRIDKHVIVKTRNVTKVK